MRFQLILLSIVAAAGLLIAHGAAAENDPANAPKDEPPGMVWIPGGEYTMGSDDNDAYPPEQPAHKVKVDGFWMDETEVTNAEFREFVEATGYVTTAEKAPKLEDIMSQVPPGTPPPAEEDLVAASLVFKQPSHEVSTRDVSQWWSWTPKADWRHPEGPGSSIEGKDDHPVVHVSWFDAKAYAEWAGKRLPSEAEWEYAARGGLEGEKYVWGGSPPQDYQVFANIWQGDFPNKNTLADGFMRTSPVKSFDPNGYGLYDMAGNVWEWCSDWYRPDMHAIWAKQDEVVNPTGPEDGHNPYSPHAEQHVIKGGSYLCHVSYCASYRPSARRGNTPDTSMSHVGFRCVMTKDMREEREEK